VRAAETAWGVGLDRDPGLCELAHASRDPRLMTRELVAVRLSSAPSYRALKVLAYPSPQHCIIQVRLTGRGKGRKGL
jgi:hypothetical protein